MPFKTELRRCSIGHITGRGCGHRRRRRVCSVGHRCRHRRYRVAVQIISESAQQEAQGSPGGGRGSRSV